MDRTGQVARTTRAKARAKAIPPARRRGKAQEGWTAQSIRYLITCNLAVRLMFGEQAQGRETEKEREGVRERDSVERTEPSICFTVRQSNKM